MNDPNAEDSPIVFPSCVRNLPLLGPAPTGTGTIALDPTFGSFTFIRIGFFGESVSTLWIGTDFFWVLRVCLNYSYERREYNTLQQSNKQRVIVLQQSNNPTPITHSPNF
jgi:hypothetical protein